jgi:hypothetical protein
MEPLIGSLVAGLLSLLFGAFGNVIFAQLDKLWIRVFGRTKESDEVRYSQRIRALMEHLLKTSDEMDEMLAELSRVTKDREHAMQRVENGLLDLQTREKELKERIEQLQNVPIPVAEHFAKLTSSGEKRSARRDYVLFGAGVVVSTVIAISLRLLGLG